MRIVDLRSEDQKAVHEAASLLVDGFREHWPSAWPDIEAALEEVRQSLVPGRIARAALDNSGGVVGWVGGIDRYGGRVWEVHPLVVRKDSQRKGIGRALIADLEALVRERGGLTLWAGSDDEDDMTTLSGVDLYPNPLEHLMRIGNLRGHPYEFYLKVGFSLVGVMPDANGPGRPDIFLVKRVSLKTTGRRDQEPTGGPSRSL